MKFDTLYNNIINESLVHFYDFTIRPIYDWIIQNRHTKSEINKVFTIDFSNSQYDFLKNAPKELKNVRVVLYYDEEDMLGEYGNGVIYLNNNSNSNLKKELQHEFIHYCQDISRLFLSDKIKESMAFTQKTPKDAKITNTFTKLELYYISKQEFWPQINTILQQIIEMKTRNPKLLFKDFYKNLISGSSFIKAIKKYSETLYRKILNTIYSYYTNDPISKEIQYDINL